MKPSGHRLLNTRIGTRIYIQQLRLKRAVRGVVGRYKLRNPPRRNLGEQILVVSIAPWATGFPAHEPAVVTPPIHFDPHVTYKDRLGCLAVFEGKMAAVSHQFPLCLPRFRPFGLIEEWREARWLTETDSLRGQTYVTDPFAKVKGPYAMFAMAGIREVGPNSYVLNLWVGAHKLGIGWFGYAIITLIGALCLSSVLEDIFLLIPFVAAIYFTAAGEWVLNTFVWPRFATDELLLKTAANEAFEASYSHAMRIALTTPRPSSSTVRNSPSTNQECVPKVQSSPEIQSNRFEVE